MKRVALLLTVVSAMTLACAGLALAKLVPRLVRTKARRRASSRANTSSCSRMGFRILLRRPERTPNATVPRYSSVTSTPQRATLLASPRDDSTRYALMSR